MLGNVGYAAEYVGSLDVYQGEALEMTVDGHKLNDVEGNFKGEIVKFYRIVEAPDPLDQITRAEFLELIFRKLDEDEPN